MERMARANIRRMIQTPAIPVDKGIGERPGVVEIDAGSERGQGGDAG
jgi:hypothetical protein